MTKLTALVPALDSALTCANVPGSSAATLALVRRYAELLDQAVAAERYAKHLRLFAHVVEDYRDNHPGLIPTDRRNLDEMERVITSALAEHSVASDLGPKLLAALTALNLTLPATASGQKPEAGRVKPADPLGDFRGEAGRLTLVREHGA